MIQDEVLRFTWSVFGEGQKHMTPAMLLLGAIEQAPAA
jgi:hypothetical protein